MKPKNRLKPRKKRNLRSVVQNIFSVEFAFVGFLLPVVSGFVLPLPVSQTKILFLFSILGAMWVGIQSEFWKRIKTVEFAASVLFVAVAAVSYLNSSEELKTYGLSKSSVFLTYTIWAFYGTLMIVRSTLALERVLWAYLGYALICCLYAIVGFLFGVDAIRESEYVGARLNVGLGNPIPLGRTAGGALIALSWIFVTNFKTFRASLFLSLGAIYATGLIGSGTRTALVGCLVTLIVLFFRSAVITKERFTKMLRLIGLCIVLALSVGATLRSLPVIDESISRIGDFFEKGMQTETGEQRIEIWTEASKMFWRSPVFGSGLGSYSLLRGAEPRRGVDGKLSNRDHPHNIILELLVELGLVGLLLFIVIVSPIIPFILSNSRGRLKGYDFVSLMAIFYLMNAMSSGDLNDNRVVFAFLAMCSVLRRKVHPYSQRDNERHLRRASLMG